MKKQYGKLAVFVCVMLFLAVGLIGGNAVRESRMLAARLLEKSADDCFARLSAFTDGVEGILQRDLAYHGWLLDLNSVKENLAGTRIVVKPDMTVVKTDSGKLASFQEAQSAEQVEQNALYFERIYRIAEKNGARFLCCPVPQKANYETSPVNVRNYNRENYEKTLQELNQRQIPYLDVSGVFEETVNRGEDLYFATDHHWKPSTGFAFARAICEMLKEFYGFNYQEEYTDFNNYEVETLQDWFLGSLGKKAGRFFLWSGAEDFDLISPQFETDLTEEIPALFQIQRGDFRKIMIDQKYLAKDYYQSNTYAAYSGGDYRLQVYRNHLRPDGPTIAVIRSSYACVVTPFLALQAGELHNIDIREGDYPEGDIVNLEQYFREIKPDYVLVIESLT